MGLDKTGGCVCYSLFQKHHPGEKEALGDLLALHKSQIGLCSQGQDKRKQPKAVPGEIQGGHQKEFLPSSVDQEITNLLHKCSPS